MSQIRQDRLGLEEKQGADHDPEDPGRPADRRDEQHLGRDLSTDAMRDPDPKAVRAPSASARTNA
jgi:hypothetical protein